MSIAPEKIMPTEIGRTPEGDLKILWQDGHATAFCSRKLRLACPCAGCVDEMTGQIRIVGSSVPEDVKPQSVALVGRYAITLRWSDGHHTGIYPFPLLRHLCECASCKPPVAGSSCDRKGGCGCNDARQS